MKKVLLLSLMAIVCHMMQAFEVNGISYTIIDGGAVVVRPGTENYITNIIYKLDYKLESNLFRVSTSSYVGDITIPSSISFEGKEYPVTGIAQCAFGYASQELLSVSLPSTIEKIGFGAFNSSKLKELILPNSVKKIGESACDKMEELERLVMPSDLDSIPSNFCKCYVYSTGIESKLKELVLPKNIKYIGEGAFNAQTNVCSMSLPNSVEYIGGYAFFNSLFPISVPTNIKYLEPYAFNMCKGLKNIKVPGRLKTIPKGCFQGTTACESIEIDEGIDSIMYYAFTIRNVNTLMLPSTLKYLDRYSIIGYSSSNGNISTLTSVYALMKEPCKLIDNEWGKSSYDPYVNTTLYVPIGCAEAYKVAGWGEYFKNIIEMDEASQRAAFAKSVTGVTSIIAPSKTNAGYFNLQGQKLDTPQKGINILRTEDGKAKKVYVK